jgi:ribosome-associated protein
MTGRSRRGAQNDEALLEARADDAERPSRTARKHASQELTRLGEDLLALRAERLAALPLPERLVDALAEAERLKSFGAKRRQAQFIGRLIRDLDAEAVAAIRAALERR